MKDAQLLKEFADERSEGAFRTLLDRHLPLVFGTARRITQNESLTEEIAQTVFLLLARKAESLSRESILSGWLYRTTRFVSMRAIRAEQRRKNREETAITMHLQTGPEHSWDSIAPRLDDALGRLAESDRRALLLHYFEGRNPAEIGEALGVKEHAARKRINRAAEKLRTILSRRGTAVTASVLAARTFARGISGSAGPARIQTGFAHIGASCLRSGRGGGRRTLR
jgi:RNA polymerase sigma factor (sigma-70 family)